MEPMSLRAYARHRGVSLRAVQKALQSGRISAREDGRLDAPAADANWARNTAPRPQPAAGPRQPTNLTKVANPAPSSPSVHHPHTASRQPNEAPKLESGLEYSKARAVRETYMARLAKIDFEERTEKLVSADEVRVASFNRFRQFRDGMLNIPDRLAAVLAAEANARRVHELLANEIRKALQEFSDANR
jgi:pyruvate/2-oxoglutarate dehydrogenase complex dihydrolipoamide acyltransferase (E2) component